MKIGRWPALSRRSYLSAEERKRAAALPAALNEARQAIRNGAPIPTAIRQTKQKLVDAGFLRIDYLALVDAGTLHPLEERQENARLIAAAVIGSTRLIDNIRLSHSLHG